MYYHSITNVITVLKCSIGNIRRNTFCSCESTMTHRMLNMGQIICFPVSSLSTQCIDGKTPEKLAYMMMSQDLEDILENSWMVRK